MRLHLVGSTPAINPKVFKLSRELKVAMVLQFIVKRLHLNAAPFLYVHNLFQITIEELVGELFDVYKTGDELVISYCLSAAFG